MAKRAKHLWPELVSFGNLLEAWRKVRLGKRYRPAAIRFRSALEDNLFDLQERLKRHAVTSAPRK